jgi:hypothetical protein
MTGLGQHGCYRSWLHKERPHEPDLPNHPLAIYPLVMNSDILVPIFTVIGTVLGGAITFIVSGQQLKAAGRQQKEWRSEDRRFQAYSEFLRCTRSYRNAIQRYYLHTDDKPSINDLGALLQAANDASTDAFLVRESEDTYQGCFSVMQALEKVSSIIHGSESSDDPWKEINEEIGRTTRQLQNAARAELEVRGPTYPWVASESPIPNSKRNSE